LEEPCGVTLRHSVRRFRSAAGELEVGETFGEYRIEGLLGEGGMAQVFLARREAGGETVALKVMKSDLLESEVFKRRFVHEARSAAEVRHECLVPILDAGEVDGKPYLAIGYVQGPTLEQRIVTEGQLPPADVLRLVAEVAAGLDALHAHGIVHRDIKASNILIDEQGAARLTDFGLAKGRAYTALTAPGQVMGTLDYLAPELIRGQPATPSSDIYALGCVVYECVAGKTPFGHKTVFEVGVAHLEEEPPDPGAERDDWSSELSWAVVQALAKDPAARPPTATAYATMLHVAAGERPE
jgi:serine/threonine-protein kinase